YPWIFVQEQQWFRRGGGERSCGGRRLHVLSKACPNRRCGTIASGISGTRTSPGSAEVHFAFADCVLDPDRRELTRGPQVVSISPKAFDLLVHLVQNRERVVSKDDLLQAVWEGRIVSESTLTSHINAVRKAIGDSGGEQRLIRTLARKGFRFVGDVQELQS